MENRFDQYILDYKSEIEASVNAAELESGATIYEDVFTEYCIDKLESVNTLESVVPLNYIQINNQGRIAWKINGYSFGDNSINNKDGEYESINLIVSDYAISIKNVISYTQKDMIRISRYLKNFLIYALSGDIDIDQSQEELLGLIDWLKKHVNELSSVKFFLLINGVYEGDRTKLEKLEIGNLTVYTEIVDLNRLFRITELTTDHEPIHIYLNDYGIKEGLPSLRVPHYTKEYDCYLSIIPGVLLADIYKEYSDQLLESNVRAFLGQKNKYNKGIKETICKAPHMFLPFNNGITATAQDVHFEMRDGILYITELYDLQIVNGGQTTASLYFTRKNYKVSLDNVFVQMKLTIIKDTERRAEVVPDIAKYANSQSKVTELDLESNNEKLIILEGLSRRMYVCRPYENPENRTILWYFERTNGQFKTEFNKRSGAKARRFKEQNPNKFVKSELAKYLKIWELQPHIVSLGSQKCFNKYKEDLKNDNLIIGENYYKKVIANAILFKEADRLYGRGSNAKNDGSVKAVTVAYTLSYFHYLTNNCLDLWRIYNQQFVDQEVSDAISKLMDFVLDCFVKMPNRREGQMYTELCKKEETWSNLKRYFRYSNNLLDSLSEYLISPMERERREIDYKTIGIGHDDKYAKIDKIESYCNIWDGLLKISPIIQDIEEDKYYKMIQTLKKKIYDLSEFKPKEIEFADIIIDLLRDDSLRRKEIRRIGGNLNKLELSTKDKLEKIKEVKREDLDFQIEVSKLSGVSLTDKLHTKKILSDVFLGNYVDRKNLDYAYKIMCKLHLVN